MIESLPSHIYVVFILSTVFCVGCLFYAFNQILQTRRSLIVLIGVILLWMLFQSILTLNQFYLDFESIPPRFMAATVSPLIFIIAVFSLPSRKLVLELPLQILTFLHVVRIPVELVLLWLHQYGQVPELMTFEGRNFDILSGLTAPLVAIFAFREGTPNRGILLIWNLLALGLLLNIVIHAILTIPSVIQQLAFDQPNRGVLYFPFIWLPSVIVPIVLFSHLASIGQLLKTRKQTAEQ